MAILDGVPGVKITIESNGQALTEYEDTDGDCDSWVADYGKTSAPGRRVSKFVESLANSNFSIKIEVSLSFKSFIQDHSNRFNEYSFWAEVDRKAIGGIAVPRLGPFPTQMSIGTTTERISKTHIASRALTFGAISKVDILDAQRVEQDAKSVKGLGEITVFMYKTQRTLDENPRDSSHKLQESVPEIAEKALKGKAVSLGVAFGEAISKPHPHYSYSYPDGAKNPVGSFRFKYRSRADLQSELVIPRSVSPDIAKSPRHQHDQQGTNPESSFARQKRLAELKREIAEIKIEQAGEAASRNPRGHKREHSLNDDVLYSTRTFKSFQSATALRLSISRTTSEHEERALAPSSICTDVTTIFTNSISYFQSPISRYPICNVQNPVLPRFSRGNFNHDHDSRVEALQNANPFPSSSAYSSKFRV